MEKAKLWDNSKGKFIGFPDYGAMTPICDDFTLKKNISAKEKKSISPTGKEVSSAKKKKQKKNKEWGR